MSQFRNPTQGRQSLQPCNLHSCVPGNADEGEPFLTESASMDVHEISLRLDQQPQALVKLSEMVTKASRRDFRDGAWIQSILMDEAI